ncbi:MAG: neutral/alkaline non-lysosomal ceramidase N-terminal domain-containing protein [Planctomycetaceae bacterium]|nr:neutral/alkaline non-lysosomal ceramidase N-terminal domain-containing protein [Planctomycetaceae bacterium]
MGPEFARLLVCVAALLSASQATAAPLEVGFAAVDVTPDLKTSGPVYLAGQESNRRAEGVHDPLFARALVLADGQTKIALVAVDSIGVQYPLVQQVRERLPNFQYVLVGSTHTHEGPDVIGIWGPSPSQSGVDPKYLDQLRDGIVAAVQKADQNLTAAHAEYGTAADPTLLKDFRLPEVLDPVLRTVRFKRADNGKTCGLLVQWNTHPVEPDGNKQITRDLIGVAVDELEKRQHAPVVYFSGPIGGLMGTPEKRFLDADGKHIAKDVYDFMRLVGTAVADLAEQALAGAQPIELTPLRVSAQPTMLPLANQGYRQARAVGVLTRPAFAPASGEADRGTVIPPSQLDGEQLVESEVAYLRLGELHVAAIPGELYPELMYGEFQEPADPGADFPSAALETPVAKILPGPKILALGLANDAVGYIVPKRQWDVAKPYAYGKKSAQYGERNSLGPDTAAAIAAALAARVAEAQASQ